MRRLRNAFYADLAGLRDTFGEQEYKRDDIIPAVVALIREHNKNDPTDLLLRDWANAVLDSAESKEDRRLQEEAIGQVSLFPHDAHIALGGVGRPRIKRGRINLDQAIRRKRVVDENHAAQNRGWDNETKWLNETIEALRGHSAHVTRGDVLKEDGTPIMRIPEPAA